MLSEMFDMNELRASLPELPWETRVRLSKDIKNSELVEVFVQDLNKRDLYEKIPAKNPELKANYIISSIMSMGATGPVQLGKTLDMIDDNKLTSTAGKSVLTILQATGGDPEKIAEEKGLLQQNDEKSLRAMVQKIISEQDALVVQYKGGKESILQALVGLMMKETKGSANPQIALKLFKEELSK